mgnify:CR=1 FL=1
MKKINNIYKISIPIYHNELEGNHGLSIVTVAYNYDENWTPSDDDLGGGNLGNGNVCDLESEPEKLEGEGLTFLEAEVQMVPTTTVKLDEKGQEKMQRLIDRLEDLDDVLEVYHNWEE